MDADGSQAAVVAVESRERTPAAGPARRRAAAVATAVAVPLTVVLVLLVNRPGPAPAPAASPSAPARVALPPVRVAAPPPLSAAAQRSCRDLVSALPTLLGDRPARPVDSPSPYVAAWGEPPVVLRCGVPRPPAFIATADTLVISGVTWFAERRGASTAWTAVDRPVYVEVLAPADDAGDPPARLSTAVTAALTPKPPDPGP
ncbi:MAG: DUF3515 domain-containing protein [Mycobacteriales bacterium]